MSDRIYAVLTGDIVRLSQAELELTRNTLISSAKQLTDWKSNLLLGGPEFFRGDPW